MEMLSLVGGGIGGIMRIVPEVMKIMQAKNERKHELEMTRLQIEIDAKRAAGELDAIRAQGENADAVGQQAVLLEAIKAQGRPTGVRWIDGISATVRPFLTYWWMALFSAYKVCTMYYAWESKENLKEFSLSIWSQGDATVLSMIVSFWFVDRVFRHHK